MSLDARGTGLSGLVQIHLRLYPWNPLPIDAMQSDLDSLCGGSAAGVESLSPMQSRQVGGGEREFGFAHRLTDTVALRMGRNEPGTAKAWNDWILSARQAACLGQAALFQAEYREGALDGEVVEQLAGAALEGSTGFGNPRWRGRALIPAGVLLEIEADDPTWVLISDSSDESVQAWMMVHWTRLVAFLLKHRRAVRRFDEAILKMEKVADHLESGRAAGRLDPERAKTMLERARVELETMQRSLVAATTGFFNALQDTVTLCQCAPATGFLAETHLRLQLADRMTDHQMNDLAERWPGLARSLAVARPRVRGAFYWSHVEEATVRRYVDSAASAVLDLLGRVRQQIGTGFQELAADTVARALYEHLRAEHSIVYDFEPIDLKHPAQRIRTHQEALEAGTCIDLACLFAAVLEGAYVPALLVHLLRWADPATAWCLPPTGAHMICAFWTGKERFSTAGPVCRDGAEFHEHVVAGRLLTIECMGFAERKEQPKAKELNVPFSTSIKRWCGTAADWLSFGCKFSFAVDLARCRAAGVIPLDQD